MQYFYVEPEVAGGIGRNTIMDRSVHPPIVKRLHYQFEGWMGDAIVESFSLFLVTERAQQALLNIGATGVSFGDVEVTVSDQFHMLYPAMLPRFVWLKPEGIAGRDDIGVAADGRLVLSQRAIDMLRALGISNAIVKPFEGKGT